jgi:hypothetical protein
MQIDNKALVLEMVEWIAAKPRPYSDVLDAWRTSCPRLSIWEDACALGLVACERRDGDLIVALTPEGEAFLSTGHPLIIDRN